MTKKFEFENLHGDTLVGALEVPTDRVRGVALFAHCFSCGKNVLAASRVSRDLRHRGFTVLRFDFTGLGESEGDFADTNFSSNVDDLRAAIDAMRQQNMAPQILIGHSLGGAAVLYLADEIEEVKLVATIGAPSEAKHVVHLFDEPALQQIEQTGQAEVSLGGRPFTIKKQFLDDVTETSVLERLKASRKPLLICHSPIDKVVGIDNAQKIYKAAKHPKSFVSLDGADHLLSGKEDADFVASVVASWASRYVGSSEKSSTQPAAKPNADHHDGVTVTERNKVFTQDIIAGPHKLVADEPQSAGGDDLGVTPYDLLLAALGACTSMTLRMYAKRKGLQVDHIQVKLQHNRIHASDCETCEDQSGKVDQIRRLIRIDGDLTEAQRQRMLEIADMCPVHRTLHNQKQITSELMKEAE
ncbi:alpha/beta fold hydrolase [Mariniblastus sp.]|nr:alpha/beta fold hydrolase [Mariniblastus sp.]